MGKTNQKPNVPYKQFFGTPLPRPPTRLQTQPSEIPIFQKNGKMLHRNIFQIQKNCLKAIEIAVLLPYYRSLYPHERLRSDFSKLIVILGRLNYPLGLYKHST